MHPVHTGRLKKMIERQSESDSCAVSCHNKLAALKVSSGVRFKVVLYLKLFSILVCNIYGKGSQHRIHKDISYCV